MKFFFALCCFSFCSACCADTTFSLAEKIEHYPTFINNLRGKVQDFLKIQEINNAVAVQDHYARNLLNQGDYFEDLRASAYEEMDDRFTKAFERLDSKLIETAKLLDTELAPNKTKVLFIRSLEAEANASIDALMRRYKKVSER